MEIVRVDLSPSKKIVPTQEVVLNIKENYISQEGVKLEEKNTNRLIYELEEEEVKCESSVIKVAVEEISPIKTTEQE